MKIAIIAQGLDKGGGVPFLTKWLADGVVSYHGFEVTLIDLATSRKDEASISLFQPVRWFSRLKPIVSTKWGYPCLKIGARFAELELCRYMPRRELTEILDTFDAVILVAGFPAVANVLRHSRRPKFLQVATRASLERQSMFKALNGPRLWYARMLQPFVDHLDSRGVGVVDGVFVENFHMLRWCEEKIGKSRTHFAPPGIRTEFFSRKTVWNDDDYILSVGRLSDARKNFNLLIRAYEKLLSTVKSAPNLVLAGLGDLTEPDKKLIRDSGLEGKIEIRRNVPLEELPSLYKAAGLFVLSSDEEGFGLVILEAMAAGLPVVATDCGGPSAMVTPGVNGLLTPVGDADALAGAMDQLLADRDAAIRYGVESRRRAEEVFRSDICVRRFAEILESSHASR